MIDLGPPPFVFPKPAIIRPASAELLRYGGDPLAAMMPGMVMTIARNAKPLTITAIGSTTVTATGNITWTNHSIGTAPAAGERRFVVACIRRYQNGDTATVSGATIGGNAANEAHVNFDASGVGCGIYWLEVPSGTTSTIVLSVSSGGGTGRGGRITVYRVIATGGGMARHESAPGVLATGAGSVDWDLPTPAGGVVVAGLQGVNTTGGHAWTGLTENDDTDINSNEFATAASAAFAGAGNKAFSASVSAGDGTQGSAASFGPVG